MQEEKKECLEDYIARTFEEVKQQICDNYCRFTSGKDADQIEDLWDSEICNNCPLNRL